MRIGFTGTPEDSPEIRIGLIGCGSHAHRNILPACDFAPVKVVAVCDTDPTRARLQAERKGAARAYTDHRQMLDDADLDAVLIVTGYDAEGRPQYPKLAGDCLDAGKHVWFEKPPAASSAELRDLARAARRADRVAMCGMKKMFFPANRKARELIDAEGRSRLSLLLLQYPQSIPDRAAFRSYLDERRPVREVIGFLDHLCHPVSLLLYLAGMPRTLAYSRSSAGAGVATFTFEDGLVASLALTAGQASNGGMERTMAVFAHGKHLVVDNNIRVSLHRNPPPPAGQGYGSTPSFYNGTPEQTTATWEPEFSLGQLYNKGLFLLGYYDEINEFAAAVRENRPPCAGTLEQAEQATRIFEAFARGEGRMHDLTAAPHPGGEDS